MTSAFVFPGQGSQSVGMMNPLAAAFPQIKSTFEEASSALGYDLWNLVANGPEDQLNQTDKTQPAMLAAGVATWRAWQSADGAAPAYMAGHSLGEYTALVCAGALQFADAVRLVADRGRFMQEAVPPGSGGMAAILGLDDDAVRKLCADNAGSEVLEAVNFNSPGQVVIAGNAGAVERAVSVAKEVGAKRAVMLPVSAPSHCALMKPAAEKLKTRLQEIEVTTPNIPVVNNADVQCYTDADKIRDALVRQLYSPVRWVETIQWLAAQGVSDLYECGPGKVLAGLNKRIERDMNVTALVDANSIAKTENA